MARIDQNLVKALGHPLRVSMLEALQGRVASPKQLSRELQANLNVVSYHAKTLLECGCIEQVRTEPRRGVLEHFLTASPRSFVGHQDWRRAPRSLRPGVTCASIGSFLDATAAAAEAGTIDDRADTTLNWMALRLDETGWAEVRTIMERAGELLTAVHERSAKRLSEADGMPVVVGLAAFEAAPGESADRD